MSETNERQLRKVAVFFGRYWDGNVPEGVGDFIDWLTALREGVPAEYRASMKFEIDTATEWDSTYATIEVSYERPETDEEMAGRIQAAARRQRERLDRARREYERLKAHFEPLPPPP